MKSAPAALATHSITESALPEEVAVNSDSRHAVPLRAKPGVRHLNSGDLLAGAREILIEHGGVCYRLRVTQNDKLILTK